MLYLNKPGQPVYQYSGFAAAGTGKNQCVTTFGGYGFTLGFIKFVEKV